MTNYICDKKQVIFLKQVFQTRCINAFARCGLKQQEGKSFFKFWTIRSIASWDAKKRSSAEGSW